jgi:hypothetical protein
VYDAIGGSEEEVRGASAKGREISLATDKLGFGGVNGDVRIEARTPKTEALSSDNLTDETSKKLKAFHCQV